MGLTTVGCGKGGDTWEKVIVEGSATLDGKKVMNGDIRFIPVSAVTGPSVGAEIVDGHYRITNKGGVPVGAHRVVLRAFNIEGIGPASGNAADEDLFGGQQAKQSSGARPTLPTYRVEGYPQFLPPIYNTKTRLKIAVTGKNNPQLENFELSSQETKE